MSIERYEGITGEELPRKINRIHNPVRLSLAEFWAIEKTVGVPSWGSVVNNPCTVYTSRDGRAIEEYGNNGMGSIFIEAPKGIPCANMRDLDKIMRGL